MTTRLLVVVMVANLIAIVAALWAIELSSKHRAPDYEWGEWKVHKE